MNKYKELLNVGDVFKNYKELCDHLGEIQRTGGDSKRAHFKVLQRYFSFRRDGHKLIIEGVFNTPKQALDGRAVGNNRFNIPLRVTNPILVSEWVESKNGKLSDAITRTSDVKYWWKCTYCESEFYRSPKERNNHITKDINKPFCDYCPLSKNAKKIFDFLKECKVDFCTEYSFKGLVGRGGKPLRFDYAVLNNDKELLLLIEYDGGYHDKELNPCPDNYEYTNHHDILKNNHCKNNNIPFLRIHHSEFGKYKGKICSVFDELDISYVKVYKPNNEEELKNKIEELESKLRKLTKQYDDAKYQLEGWE